MKTTFALAALCGLTAFSLNAGCRAKEHPLPNVGTVNGEALSADDFTTALRTVHGAEILERLVQQRIVFQEAKAANVTVSDEELKDAIAQHGGAEDTLPKFMQDEVRRQLLLRKLLLKDVTEADKQHVFDVYKDELTRYQLYQILVPNLDQAKQVRIALQTGSKFATLAATSSTDSSTKTKGGLVGWASKRSLISTYGPRVAKAIMALKDGEPTEPFQLNEETVGVFVVDKRLTTYPELQAAIEDVFLNRSLNEYIYKLTSKAQIESPFLPKDRKAAIGLPSAEKNVAAPKTPGAPAVPTPILEAPAVAPPPVEEPPAALPSPQL